MAEPQFIIDHLVGARRGKRQIFALSAPVRFGRHPECEVCFDAHRDLDASSRHAEIERDGDRFLLRDTGSSNGTFVAGQRVTEVPLLRDEPVVVEFGAGGPRVRVFYGELDRLPPVPAISNQEPLAPGVRLTLAAIAAGIVAVAVWAWVAWV